jgi:hypothetical protein
MRVHDGRKRGWFWVHDRIFDEWGETLGAVNLAVYMCLCRHADDAGQCYPSFATIARKCGVGRRTAITAVAALERHGLIAKSPRTATQGDPDSNIYTLLEVPHCKVLVAVGSASAALPLVQQEHHPSAADALPLVQQEHHPSAADALHKGLHTEGRQLRTTTTMTDGSEKTRTGSAGGGKSGSSSGCDGSLKNTQQASRQEDQPAAQQATGQPPAAQQASRLIYPIGMAEDETTKAAAMLEGNNNAQELLDTVEAARRAGQIKKSALALLSALIRRDKAGTFDPTPGYEIANERRRSGKAKVAGISRSVEISNLQGEIRALERLEAYGGDTIKRQLDAARDKLSKATALG